MKNKLAFIVSLAAFAFTTFAVFNAHAWTKVGNGGDVVVCTDPEGEELVELLDVFEAREVYGKKPDLPRNRMAPTDLALKLVERIAELAPARKQMFETYIKNFDQETVFVDYELQDIPDHGFIRVPANCVIRQLVVNACSNAGDSFYDKGFDPYNPDRGWVLNHQKINAWHEVCPGRYQINRKLWSLLPRDEQALVKTHEAFMRDFRHMGDLDFEFDGPYHPVRYFNGLLFTSGLKNYDFSRFQRLYGAQGRRSAVEELPDGRLILEYQDRGDSVLAYVVPQIGFDVHYLPGIGHASDFESLPRLLIGSSQMIFEKKPTVTPHSISMSFSSQSPIVRKKGASYGEPEMRYSGAVTLEVSVASGWKDLLGFQDLFSGEFPGGQLFETGFTLEPSCDYDPVTESRDNVVEAHISSHSQKLVDWAADGTGNRYIEVSYLPSANFKVKNVILDIEVLARQTVTERRPFLENTICSKSPKTAKFMSFKATGRVFYRGRWRTINDKYVHVDLVTMKVESIF